MDFDGVPIVTQPSEERLNKKQLLDYQEHREAFISWLLALGKNPKGATGYSHATVRRTAYRTDQFNRWVWDQEETYTTNISHGHADDYMKELAYSEQSNTHKSNTQKSIKRFFTGSIFQQLLIELLVQQSVRILDTPVDSQWLRVRDGPSLRQPQNDNWFYFGPRLNLVMVDRHRWHGRWSPWIGALFGLFGGIYTALTGDYFTWRVSGDPLLPMDALFHIHPLLGIAVFILIGFAAGWIIRWTELLKP